MLKIISWWVRNSKAANLLMFSIIIIGILNFFRVEKEVFPIITAPVVSIKYGWPGASPKEIEDQILVRVEESLTDCLLYTSPSPRDTILSRMPSSA